MAGSMGSKDLPVMGFFKRIFLLDMATNMGVLWNLGYATTNYILLYPSNFMVQSPMKPQNNWVSGNQKWQWNLPI